MQRAGRGVHAGILAELPAIVGRRRCRPRWATCGCSRTTGRARCSAGALENREAALRFVAGVTPTTAGGANVEVKPVDGTANPYLAIGALLAAGLHGLDAGDRLPPSTEEDPDGLCPTT